MYLKNNETNWTTFLKLKVNSRERNKLYWVELTLLSKRKHTKIYNHTTYRNRCSTHNGILIPSQFYLVLPGLLARRLSQGHWVHTLKVTIPQELNRAIILPHFAHLCFVVAPVGRVDGSAVHANAQLQGENITIVTLGNIDFYPYQLV